MTATLWQQQDSVYLAGTPPVNEVRSSIVRVCVCVLKRRLKVIEKIQLRPMINHGPHAGLAFSRHAASAAAEPTVMTSLEHTRAHVTDKATLSSPRM